MTRTRTLVLVAISAAAPLLALETSGGSRGGAPRPLTRAIDKEKYRRGERHFIGRRPRSAGLPLATRPLDDAPPAPDEEHRDRVFEQRLRLLELEGELSREERLTHRLTERAGKLSAGELLSMKYYLRNRRAVEAHASSPESLAVLEAGENVFLGRTPLEDLDPARRAEQAARLKPLLEASAVAGQDLSRLSEHAGRLAPGDLDALEAYLKARLALRGSLEVDTFRAGERVFKGEPAGDSPSSPQALEERRRAWKRLEDKLPPAARRRVDLVAAAAELDAKELEALEYYLEVRYGIKLESDA
jgi:hypothetical protein